MQSIQGLLIKGMQINSAVPPPPPPPGSPLYGTISGYSSGGGTDPSLPGSTNVIEKFPFASDSNSTDVGDLNISLLLLTGNSSDTNGYTWAGAAGAPPGTPLTGYAFADSGARYHNKFPFATDTNSTLIATYAGVSVQGSASISSPDKGYMAGNLQTLSASQIRSYPFASETTINNSVGLTTRAVVMGGISSTANGYTVGGRGTPPAYTVQNVIDKFPFATNANAADVGDLTAVRTNICGVSSVSYGYAAGGQGSSPTQTGPVTNIIDKFPFASDSNATDVGDLATALSQSTDNSSSSQGYVVGGGTPSPNADSTKIQKFPFASDSNSTNVADLLAGKTASSPQNN